jgi:hypothetical protein
MSVNALKLFLELSSPALDGSRSRASQAQDALVLESLRQNTPFQRYLLSGVRSALLTLKAEADEK